MQKRPRGLPKLRTNQNCKDIKAHYINYGDQNPELRVGCKKDNGHKGCKQPNVALPIFMPRTEYFHFVRPDAAL